jgi:phosphatidylserine/phosphatidylglycerophosphate/cardiolipin synthase-like enzyme
VVPVIVASLAVLPAAAVAGGGPTVTVVHPNPVAEDDAGEFVVVSVPPDTDLGRFELGDGDARVPLPNVTASGRVTLSADPNATRRLLDRRVRRLPDGLRLANGGERLRLYRDGAVVDAVAYRDAPEGERMVAGAEDRWQPMGATDRPVVTAGRGRVTAFVLPDAPGIAVEHLRAAEDRIMLAGYTLTAGRVADALVAATRRNVSVRVLVDGGPVGGMTRRQATVLDRVARAGADVRVLGGDYARYRFHHAKYAVADGRALVTTENWKPVGVGGRGSRGWGVVTGQQELVAGLVATFRSDAGWRDARPWETVRGDREFVDDRPANRSYPTRFEPARLSVERARLVVAPDNAESAVVAAIASAEESLSVEQVSLGGRRQPFVRATLRAARRGVRVRVLLSGAWYTREENERLVAWLNDRAAAEDLSLSARIADPRGRFGKIHAKGAVVDGERAILGSLNWNNVSARENREVALILDGEAAGYYRRVFAADWRASAWQVPAGLVAAVLAVAAVTLLAARRIRFEHHTRQDGR